MSKNSGSETVNTGSAPKKEGPDEFAIGNNVREKGQDPSPDDRDRGETSDKEPGSAIDVGAAHDRAR